MEDVAAHDPRLGGRRLGAWAFVVVAAAAYCGIAATTRPFTTGAETVTAVAYAPAAALLLRSLRGRRAGRRRVPVTWRAALPWAAVIGASAAWELVTYVAGSGDRHAFPTVSSLFDVADGHAPAKGAVFALWLALGWALVRR